MSKALVIVESPAKAKTIAGYLGAGFVVDSSIGHIRELVTKPSDLPSEYQDKAWARFGINLDGNFEPFFILKSDSKKQVAQLKRSLKNADELYLATDEDREGERIAWDLLEVLQPKVPVKRMVFHEVTKEAITEALRNAREIDEDLVAAQMARQKLDKIVGFALSPLLWLKLSRGLSAGRVQSVATRLIVERERERMAFTAADYWGLTCNLAAESDGAFDAQVVSVDGRRVAESRHFDDEGNLTDSDLVVIDKASAELLRQSLNGQTAEVTAAESKPFRRKPPPPFTTSTFQQAAGNRLKLSPARAMAAAQALYLQGFITYMRTDSTTLSDTAVRAARNEVVDRFGREFLPAEARSYVNKVRNAQEAHEAIRPAGDRFVDPNTVRKRVPPAQASVYKMIWRRTVASQMTDVAGETLRIELTSDIAAPGYEQANLAATGTTIHHAGFRKAYENLELASDDQGTEAEDDERLLPTLTAGQTVDVVDVAAEGHSTRPPARYTESSLVKGMEEHGVGRPSTYAGIVQTIQKKYVFKKGSALVPTLAAFAVTRLLEKHFPRVVDYTFTADLEDDLDRIANGELDEVEFLRDFWRGSDNDIGLKAKVHDRAEEIVGPEVNFVELGLSDSEEPVLARYSKFGPYVQLGEVSKSIPEDVVVGELTVEQAMEYLNASSDRELGIDPATGLPVWVMSGKYGPYVMLGEPPEQPSPLSPEGRVMALPKSKKEIKVALAFLRLAEGRLDPSGAKQILNVPKRDGLGPAVIKRIMVATEAGRPVLDVLRTAGDLGIPSTTKDGVLSGQGKKTAASIKAFLKFGKKLAARSSEGPRAVLESAIDLSGYGAKISALEDGEDRKKNLDALAETLDYFDDLEAFVDELDRQSDQDNLPKPKTQSLFKTMTFERITLDDALQLLSLPRVVGADPADGVEITVQNGKFGPYLKKGSDTRSLENEEQLLTISLDECLAVLARPKKKGKNAPKVVRDLSRDQETEKLMFVLEGKFGFYVTDGEVNASLPLGVTPESLTDERASELLAERRAALEG